MVYNLLFFREKTKVDIPVDPIAPKPILVDSESRWHFKSINIHTQGDTWSLFSWCQTRSRISLFEILIWKYFSASTALTEKKSGVECTHDNKASSPHKAPRTQPAAALKRKYKKNAPTPTTREIEFSAAVIITLESELIILMPCAGI